MRPGRHAAGLARLARLAVIALAAALAGSGWAAQAGAPPAPVAEAVLDNGLRVLHAAPARPSDRAEVLLVVAAGRGDEEPGQGGAAWTAARATLGGEVAPGLGAGRALALQGATVEVAAGESHTVLRCALPAARLAPVLDLLAALVGRDELPAAAWMEAAVQRNRASRAEAADPWRRAGLLLDRALARGAAAEPDAARSAGELAAFRRARYRPDGMVLGVVASLPHAAVLERAAASFGRLPATPPALARARPGAAPARGPAGALAPSPRASGGRPAACERIAGLAPPVVVAGWDLAAPDEASFYGWQVLAHVLGGGHDSRLNRRLRLAEGLAATVEAVVEPGPGGRLTLRLAARSDAPERVLDAFLEEAARLAEEPLGERELRAARAVVGSRLALSRAAAGDRLLARALAGLGLGPAWAAGDGGAVSGAADAAALLRLARGSLRRELAGSAVLADRLPPLCAAPPPGGADAAPPLGLAAVPVPAGNPLTPAKAELGRRLFFDARLSADGAVSCATCHRPELAFADHGAVSTGVGGQTGHRNAPSLLNAAYAPRLFWDGRSIDLEDQVRYPVTHPKEMNRRREDVVAVVAADPAYRRAFAAAFGDPEVTFERVSQALASFQRTLLSGGSPFDRFFFGGDTAAISADARRGWELFRGRAGCIRCHRFDAASPFFTDWDFHNTGVGWDRVELPDLGRFRVTRDPADRGRFRTPSLRTAALTPPYMHDGRFATLAEVVAFYAAGGIPNRYLDERIGPLELSAGERADLVAFIESLAGRVPAVAGGGGAERPAAGTEASP